MFHVKHIVIGLKTDVSRGTFLRARYSAVRGANYRAAEANKRQTRGELQVRWRKRNAKRSLSGPRIDVSRETFCQAAPDRCFT